VWMEDDAAVIAPVLSPLEDAGYQVLRVHSVHEALGQVGLIREADVILMDVILPMGGAEMDLGVYPGLGLLRHLREKEGLLTPVVVFSVMSPDDFQAEIQELGIADFVEKPVLPSELKRRVERVVKSASRA